MRIAMIWAMAQNRVIGRNNNLPWHLPNDLKYFKRVTSGKPVIMGRKTFESIGRPLPNRINIVVTRNSNFEVPGVKVVSCIEDAIELAEAECLIAAQEEVIIMGGAEIYKQCLPIAHRLYITFVHADVEGDSYFPEFDLNAYREVSREDYEKDGPNPFDYSITVYDRPEPS